MFKKIWHSLSDHKLSVPQHVVQIWLGTYFTCSCTAVQQGRVLGWQSILKGKRSCFLLNLADLQLARMWQLFTETWNAEIKKLKINGKVTVDIILCCAELNSE